MATKTQERSKVSFALPSFPSVPSAPLEIDYSGDSSGAESDAEDRFIGGQLETLSNKLSTHHKKKTRKTFVRSINKQLKDIERKDGSRCVFVDSRTAKGKPCDDFKQVYRDRKTGQVVQSRYCAKHRTTRERTKKKNQKKAEQALYDATSGENNLERRIHNLGSSRDLEERMRNLGVNLPPTPPPSDSERDKAASDESYYSPSPIEISEEEIPLQKPKRAPSLTPRADKIPESAPKLKETESKRPIKRSAPPQDKQAVTRPSKKPASSDSEPDRSDYEKREPIQHGLTDKLVRGWFNVDWPEELVL